MIAPRNFAKLGRRHIDFNDLPGKARMYSAFDVDNKLLVGRALVIHENNGALLWDIKVDPKYQRMGFGSNILFAIKQSFMSIVTAWYSEAGKNLCLKNGFVLDTTGKVPKLVWIKEVEDVKE